MIIVLPSDFILGTRLVNDSVEFDRLVIFYRFPFFNNNSIIALKLHSAKYEDGNCNNNFLAKWVVFE